MTSGFGGSGVELAKELFAGLEDHGWELVGCEIEDVGGEDDAAKLRQGGDVDGEAAHRHGFVVTLEFRVGFGDPLQRGAGALHLGIKVLEEDFGDRH